MLILIQQASGTRRILGTRNIVGRSHAADLHLPHDAVSGEHATLWWDGRSWKIRDLASRNGTFVQGERIAAGVGTLISAGHVLSFGDPDQPWRVEQAHPPVAAARDVQNGDWVQAEDDFLVLPGPDAPELTVFADIDGNWQIEGPDTGRATTDLETVFAGGRVWRLYLPQATVGTVSRIMRPTLETLALAFAVSRDEEHVELVAQTSSGEVDLKARAHNYPLLLLARARLHDAQDETLQPDAHGWLYQEELCRMLGVDASKLNLLVFRARKHLSAAGVEGAAGIVERRVATRQLRIGVGRLVIRQI